ncbi:biotin--protein ligase-like [Physella acuta]|uniref:biotin--protein ligase-like n=1 Tax=Physella acuta TaxID=109671 RepID=UPI0027DAE9F5|nr:biotin--protein ligase-like [Physella acuta]
MPFLTLGNFVLMSMQWLYETLRQRRYGLAMNRLLRTSSILVQKLKKSNTSSLAKSLLFEADLGKSERIEFQDDYISISAIEPVQEVDLSTWTSYTSYIEVPNLVPEPQQNICLLLEARRPKNLERFLNETLNILPAYRVHVLLHGYPIAWKTADPFAIVLHCSFPGLIALTDAFGQGRLTFDEDLELLQLVTITTKGSPQKLVPNVYESMDTISGTTVDINSKPLDRGITRGVIGAHLDDSEPVNEDQPTFVSSTKLVLNQPVVKEDSSLQVKSTAIHNISVKPEADDRLDQPQQPADVGQPAAGDRGQPITGDIGQPAAGDKDQPVANDNGLTTNLPKPHTKPPNILVYCGAKDTARIFSEVKSSLESSINTDAYTIYHLSQEKMLSAPWSNNTALLIVSSCAQLQQDVEDKVVDYVLKDCGRLLSFNTSVDARFAQKVEEEDCKGDRVVTFRFGDCDHVTTVRGRFYYYGMSDSAEVIIPYENAEEFEKSLGHSSEADGVKKALVLKTIGMDGGVVILSQLLLERDPTEFACDQESFASLKRSNADRLTVFRELLTSLGIDTSPGVVPPLTPCLLLVRRIGLKESFLESFKYRLHADRVLKAQKISLKFLQSPDDTAPTSSLLPVMTSTECDVKTKYFDLTDYWMNLKTSVLGQVVFYTDVITTTMTVFEGLLFSIPDDVGVIAIAGRQTSGKGRGGNAWISPEGCAMFTLPLTISLDSELGHKVSFLQHLVSLAVVKSVVTLPGYENLDLKLKWPNDIYYGKEMKLGGVLVTSTVMGSKIFATIGCGFNVSNSNPTICINDIIRRFNSSHTPPLDLSPLSVSQLIGRTVTSLESLVQEFERSGHRGFCQEYYKYWLHTGATVTVQLDQPTVGEIIGLDEHGFLSIRTTDNVLMSVQPDGNSFDMMHNLIYVKS